MKPKPKPPWKPPWWKKLDGRACVEAMRWAKSQRTFGEAWRRCRRADWMRWLVARIYYFDGPNHRTRYGEHDWQRCWCVTPGAIRKKLPYAKIKKAYEEWPS